MLPPQNYLSIYYKENIFDAYPEFRETFDKFSFWYITKQNGNNPSDEFLGNNWSPDKNFEFQI